MANLEILTKAFQKAIEQGFSAEIGHVAIAMLPDVFAADEEARDNFVRGLVLDHDLAKALWGEDWACEWYGHPMGGGDLFCCHDDDRGTVTSVCGAAKSVRLKVWQYHLQQMVVADDPIKYLGENI